MPTDDDYGRRERLLLHQHNATQFGSTLPPSSQLYSTCSTTSGATTAPNFSSAKSVQNCIPSQERGSERSSNIAAVSECRYQKRAGGSHQIDDYSGRYEPRHTDRYDEAIGEQQSTGEQECYEETRQKERYSQQQQHPQTPYQYFAVRIGFGNDRYSTFAEHRATSEHSPCSGNGNASSGEQRGGQCLLPGVNGDRFQQADRFHQTTSHGINARGRDSNEEGHYVNPTGLLSSELFPSPPSPAPANDRFIPPPPLSPTPSEKYASLQSLSGYAAQDHNRASGSPSSKDRFGLVPPPVASPMPSKERTREERFTSSERLLANASPALGQLQSGESRMLYSTIVDKDPTTLVRYSFSSERLLLSSPMQAPAPERFGNRSNAPAEKTQSSASPRHHHAERYLSSSPNPEGARQRYASTERVLLVPSPVSDQQNSSRHHGNAEARYPSERSSGSTPPNDHNNGNGNDPRIAALSHQEQRHSPDIQSHGQRYGNNDHSNEMVVHSRYGQQPRIERPDRFAPTDHHLDGTPSNSRSYMPGVALPGSSADRLMVSSSPLLDTTRYGHHGGTAYSDTTSQTTSSNDRYSSSLSPTMDCNGRLYPSGVAKACGEKYYGASKNLPSYASESYQITSQSELQFERNPGTSVQSILDRSNRLDRFQLSPADRFQCGPTNDHRFSVDKYLSLPKSKDRLAATGPIASAGSACPTVSSDRAYVSAHTPVERYVPQPPPEILYPGYVDAYVHQTAHTPTDRYVSVMDPGDPYMRRDLGFHHHYRLPPPAYPYHHQSHYRFRGYTYASPARLGGSPGSSSSSSSTSAQREFTNSPLLRPKVRVSAVEFSTPNHIGQPQHVCCSDANPGPAAPQRCCAPVRRSLTPSTGSMSSVPTQTNASTSWQSSSGSRATSTPPIPSSVQQEGGATSQALNNAYVVVGSTVSGSSGSTGSTASTGSTGSTGSTSSSGSTESTGSTGSTETNESGGIRIMESTTTSMSNTSSPAVPLTTNDGPNLARSVSAPTGPRPLVEQIPSFASHSNEFQRHRLQRNASRSEAIKNYIRRETATFFGVNEDCEAQEKQRWLERRRRMASRKYGTLLPEYRPRDPDITRDVPDIADIPEGVTLRRWYQPVRRKESVARMTLSGLSYMVSQTLARHRSPERTETRPESRSFPPSTVPSPLGSPETYAADEESFFERPPLPPPPPPSPPPPPTPPPLLEAVQLTPESQSQGAIDRTMLQPKTSEDEPSGAALRVENINPASSDLVDASASVDRDFSEELVRFTIPKDERTLMPGKDHRRSMQTSRDRYSRSSSWRRPREPSAAETVTNEDEVIMPRQSIGGNRISPNTIDRIFDNSNRRQYGMGIVGRFFGRSFRKSVAQKPEVKKQLDDIEDHRPFFTYWITTVQVLILVISLACYGFGPFGFELNHRSGLVLVTSLSLQQVDYQEPANFWIGPRAADLIHLGAKFAPCMRRDIKILNEIDVWRERERDTACCIRNDDSGCVQSSKQDCSNTISTWKKWGPGDNGPGGRISGSVCGLDPKFCDAPASIAPYEWPDDITKWPICRKTNPFSQRFSKGNQESFSVGRHLDKMAEHMVCEVIGHPCCIGIHGMCRITTKEYCDFVHGYFHEEASLCSQVECLHDVCGMIPFLHPEWPDQFYRLFTSLFLHAGLLHITITLCVQYFFMRDLEKLTGSLRIAMIYFTGGLTGNLASAIFVPYRAEVGPAGAHFALLATLVVEVLNSWPMLKHPRRALMKLLGSVLCLLLLGTLPWVDNYAHLFGFIFGFLAAYAVMPFISFGEYDRRRKILLIWICLILIVGLFAILLVLFYNISVYECEVCKLFTCIPFTRDFCASQNINFKKEEPV